MPKSATEVMRDIIAAAAIDAAVALKGVQGGLPNAVLRELGAIHANTGFADLPREVQDAIEANVRTAFNRLLREGYAIADKNAPPLRPAPRPEPRGPAPAGRRTGSQGERPGPRQPRGPGGPRRGGSGKPSS